MITITAIRSWDCVIVANGIDAVVEQTRAIFAGTNADHFEVHEPTADDFESAANANVA